MSEWRDISTAPKDGTVIDVWLGDATDGDVDFYCGPGTRRATDWYFKEGRFRPAIPGTIPLPTFVEPTHWTPRPTPPEDG